MTIRTLSSYELPKYAAHLRRLNAEDRYLRFGYAITDGQIGQYVASQFRTKSAVLAIFDDNLDVVAAMEVVYDFGKNSQTNTLAEIGLSVEEGHRGQGYGSTLFERALVQARNRGCKTLVSHCLSQNRFMMRIARKNGMEVHTEYGQSTGELALDKADSVSIIEEMVGEGMGMWDYTMMSIPALLNYGDLMAHPMEKKQKGLQ